MDRILKEIVVPTVHGMNQKERHTGDCLVGLDDQRRSIQRWLSSTVALETLRLSL